MQNQIKACCTAKMKVSVAYSGFCLGMDRISSSEEEVSSVSSEEETPPCSPPPEDSRCEYRIDRQ